MGYARLTATMADTPHQHDEPFREGLRLFQQQRYDEARPRMREAAQSGGPAAPHALVYWIETMLRAEGGPDVERTVRDALDGSDLLLHHGLAFLARRRGDWQAALEHSEAAVSGDGPSAASMLERGLILSLVGRRREGGELLRTADQRLQREGDLEGEALAARYRAIHAYLELRLGECLRLLDRAEALCHRTGNTTGLATIHEHRAGARLHLAQYRAALDAYREALALRREQNDPLSAAFTHNGIANCHLDLDNPEAARGHLLEALEAFRDSGNRWGEAAVRANLGFCSRLVGDRPAAVQHYEAALEILEREGQPGALANAAANLAEVLTKAGEPARALEALGRITPEILEHADLRSRLEVLTERGRARLALDEPGAALEEADRALHLELDPGPMLIKDRIEAEVVRGRALVALGRGEEGHTALEEVGRRLDDLLGSQPGLWVRMGIMDRHREAHDALVESHLARTDGDPAAAWAVSQRAKARTLLEAEPVHGHIQGAGQGGVSELDEIEARIRALASSREVAVESSRELRELRRSYGELLMEEEEGRRDPPRPLGPPEAAELLAGGGAVLDYHLGHEGGWVFVVRADRVCALELDIPPRELEEEIRRALEPLQQAGAAYDPSAWLRAFDAGAPARLRRLLLDPCLDLLPSGCRELTIVPDGPLHLLPFELLAGAGSRVPGGPGGERSVLRFRYLPSATMLLPPRPPARDEAPSLLALAFSPPPGSVLQGPGGPGRVDPLPGALSEVRALTRLFPRSRQMSGRNATAEAWMSLAPGYDILHLAAHAMADPWAPGLSGLVLASRDEDGAVDFFTARSIRRCSLEARLVTLSACETVHGRLRRREGLLGLARAFLEAGAEAVLASLWPVEDEATRILMRRFYGEVRDGASPASALETARSRLRTADSGRWEHPFFWAPYVLFDRRAPESRAAR